MRKKEREGRSEEKREKVCSDCMKRNGSCLSREKRLVIGNCEGERRRCRRERLTKYERSSVESGDDDGNEQEFGWRTNGAEQSSPCPCSKGLVRAGGPRCGSRVSRTRVARSIRARCRAMGIRLSLGGTEVEFKVRVGDGYTAGRGA